MPAAEVEHVVRSYAGKLAVDDLSFPVNKGEMLGLTGGDASYSSTSLAITIL